METVAYHHKTQNTTANRAKTTSDNHGIRPAPTLAGLPLFLSGSAPPFQASLRIGQPGDRYEREADHIAGAMLSLSQPPAHTVQRSCSCGGTCSSCRGRYEANEVIQRKADGPASSAASSVELRPTGSGQPIDADTRRDFEAHFGQDFGGVRVHTGREAAQQAESIGARAYTAGHDIVFGAGEYAPASAGGRHLLAHELAHVVQQRGGTAPDVQRDLGPSAVIVSNAPPGPSRPSDDPLAAYPGLVLALEETDLEILRSALETETGAPLAPAPEDTSDTPETSQGAPNPSQTTRSATLVSVPLRNLLSSDTQYSEVEDEQRQIIQLLRSNPQDLRVGTMLINKTIRLFMTGQFSDEQEIDIAVEHGGRAPRLVFHIGGVQINNGDGYIRMSELVEAYPDQFESVLNDVQSDLAQTIEIASVLRAAANIDGEVRETATEIRENLRKYARNDVNSLRSQVSGVLSRMDSVDAGPMEEDLNNLRPKVQEVLDDLTAAVAEADSFIEEHNCNTSLETIDRAQEHFTPLGKIFVNSNPLTSHGGQIAGNRALNAVTGGAIDDIDQACIDFRTGEISLDAKKELANHAAIRAGVALGLSIGLGIFGGWVGSVAARGLGFAAGTLVSSFMQGVGVGAVGSVGFLAGQDLYNVGVVNLTSDPYVRARSGRFHTLADYGMAFGIGGLMGGGLGALGYFMQPRGVPPVAGAAAPEGPILLFDASDNPIMVQGGQATPVQLGGGGGGLVDIYNNPLVADAAQAATPDIPIMMYDASNRPIMVQGGEITSGAASGRTTILGHSRLVDSSGRSLYLPEMGEGFGGTGTGPQIIDLQGGTPIGGQQLAAQNPGSTVQVVEPGNYLLAYQNIYPTHPEDAALALALQRNSPIWPNTPAWATPAEDIPALLPWEIDPATQLFPQSGQVQYAFDPLNPHQARSFFPAYGGRMNPQVHREIPFGLEDIMGFNQTPLPELQGFADQIYLRRAFGVGQADEQTTRAMAEQIRGLFRRGGGTQRFIEIRRTRATDFSIEANADRGMVNQQRILAEAMGGEVHVVRRSQIIRFRETGEFPPGANAIEREMIRNAAQDVEGLGQGELSHVIRIYLKE